MQTKTYFATSVPAALEVARRELGSDAMLVSSRPAPADVRAFGRLEVTFAFDEKRPESVPAEERRPEFQRKAIRSEAVLSEASRSEMDDLRRQIAALRDAVGNRAEPPMPSFEAHLEAAGGELDRGANTGSLFVERLIASGLSTEFARELTRVAAGKQGNIENALEAELGSRIQVNATIELKPGECRTMAFIGPPGRGKSTTLVKVAFQYGLARRTPVRIYSAGAHGIGGQEQMARFAALLGVPFQAFESLESLHLALNGDSWRGLILLDTPGLSRDEMAEFSSFFGKRPEIEKHLVLRADTRAADLMHSVSAFSSLKPSRLLFTGIDEALTLGAITETLARTGIPAVFAGTGRQVPEGLGPADATTWVRTVCFGRVFAAAAAAA